MKLLVHKTTTLQGQVTVPSSKSQTIRGLVFGLLAQGRSVLENVLDSDDARDALHICRQLGADIKAEGSSLVINSPGLPLQSVTDTLYSGNSGITTRFILPSLGFRQGADIPAILDCGEQMRARPITPLVTALTKLGLTIDYVGGKDTCPIAVSGQLQGGIAEVGGLSSQYISALLINLPCAPKDSEITVHDLHERPYMELTLRWLDEQGIRYHHEQGDNNDVFYISGGQRYQPFHKRISGDFSSASYLIAAAVLQSGRVELQGLDMHDAQGDKRLVTILQAMGADIRVESERLVIHGGKPLTGIKIDANDIPDLLPTLAVIGTAASGKTEICNVAQARIKETDRIHSMTQGLTRLGAQVEEHADGMTIYASTLRGAEVHGFDDHRTVMSLALAGMLTEQPTFITDAEAMDKTFPNFVALMQSLGARMELQHDA